MSTAIWTPPAIIAPELPISNPLLGNQWPVTRCSIHPFDSIHEEPRRYNILVYKPTPSKIPTMLRLEYWSRVGSHLLPTVRLDWRAGTPEEQDYEFNEIWKLKCPIWQQPRQHVVAAEERTQLNNEEAVEVLGHFNRLHGIVAMRAQEFPQHLRPDYFTLYSALKPFVEEITSGYLSLFRPQQTTEEVDPTAV